MLAAAPNVCRFDQHVTRKRPLDVYVPLLVHWRGPAWEYGADAVADQGVRIRQQTGDKGIRQRRTRGWSIRRCRRLAQEDGRRGFGATPEVAEAGPDAAAAGKIKQPVSGAENRIFHEGAGQPQARRDVGLIRIAGIDGLW